MANISGSFSFNGLEDPELVKVIEFKETHSDIQFSFPQGQIGNNTLPKIASASWHSEEQLAALTDLFKRLAHPDKQ